MFSGLESLNDDYQHFLSSIAPLVCAQYYYNVGWPLLLPLPFHWVYVPTLYFDHGIYGWIFCVMVADTRALAADLGRSGLHKDDSDVSIAVANLNCQISKRSRLNIRSRHHAISGNTVETKSNVFSLKYSLHSRRYNIYIHTSRTRVIPRTFKGFWKVS